MSEQNASEAADKQTVQLKITGMTCGSCVSVCYLFVRMAYTEY